MNSFFCLWLEVSVQKKWQGTASLRVVHDAKFPYFFFQMDTPSTNKTNKFIPYHFITSKHKYHGIKRYIFFLFVYALYILWHLSIASHIDEYKIYPIFQPIEKLMLHEKLNDY
jgi:hypothetical protein